MRTITLLACLCLCGCSTSYESGKEYWMVGQFSNTNDYSLSYMEWLQANGYACQVKVVETNVVWRTCK